MHKLPIRPIYYHIRKLGITQSRINHECKSSKGAVSEFGERKRVDVYLKDYVSANKINI